MSKFLVSAAVAAAMVMGSSAALAESKSKSSKHREVETSEEGDGYGYKFDDDLLSAGGFDAMSGMIKVRQGIVRRTLIRPRTNFVPEMLKSIELI